MASPQNVPAADAAGAPSEGSAARRSGSFGQSGHLSVLDRLGTYLSARRVRRSLGALAGLRVGDFGSGFDARLARSLRRGGAELVVVDLSLAPDLASLEGVRAIEGTLPAAMAEVPTASLDAALCISVLEHLDDPLKMLQELRRVLAPGGTAIVNVPTWFAKRFLEFSAFRLGLSPAEEMDDHRTYYDPRDLWPLLVRAGFVPHHISCRRYKFAMNTFARCRTDAAPTMGAGGVPVS